MPKGVEIIRASWADRAELQKICRETYTTYFGAYWEGQGLDLYLTDQFGDERLNADLMNTQMGYYFIALDGVRVGFLKINFEAELDGFETKTTCELEKMYVYPQYKGLGLGTDALGEVIKQAHQIEKVIMFLDVLDTNDAGIAFYEKLGFVRYAKTNVKAPYFIQDLSGLHRMILRLNQAA